MKRLRRWWYLSVTTPIWWSWHRPWASGPLLGHTPPPPIVGRRADLLIWDDPV